MRAWADTTAKACWLSATLADMDAGQILLDRWSWRERAQGGAADTVSACSGCCIGMVEDALRRMTPKLLRCIFSLQRRTLMRRSAALASCTSQAMALLKTTLKRCGGGSLLPPKDILMQIEKGRHVSRAR